MMKNIRSIFCNINSLIINVNKKRISTNIFIPKNLNNAIDENNKNSSFIKYDNKNFRRKKTKDYIGNEEFLNVIAYSTGEEYNLDNIKHDLKKYQSFKLMTFPEDAYDTLHFKLSVDKSTINENMDAFIFKEGSVVFWNFPDNQKNIILETVKKNQQGSYKEDLIEEQKETFKFAITNQCSLLDGDIYINPQDNKHQLQMFTFSNALSLSVKLAIWEAFLDEYIASIEYVLEDLKDGKIKISEAEVIKKAGELFSLSYSINLSSDLLNTPDIYWDHDELEKLFNILYQYLSISRRTKVMNVKIEQCFDLMNLVRDYIKDFHHTRLEYMIIFLIFIEVIFGVYHIVSD